jgi:hypothetical protein
MKASNQPWNMWELSFFSFFMQMPFMEYAPLVITQL